MTSQFTYFSIIWTSNKYLILFDKVTNFAMNTCISIVKGFVIQEWFILIRPRNLFANMAKTFVMENAKKIWAFLILHEVNFTINPSSFESFLFNFCTKRPWNLQFLI